MSRLVRRRYTTVLSCFTSRPTQCAAAHLPSFNGTTILRSRYHVFAPTGIMQTMSFSRQVKLDHKLKSCVDRRLTAYLHSCNLLLARSLLPDDDDDISYIPLGRNTLTDEERTQLKRKIIDKDVQRLTKKSFHHLGIIATLSYQIKKLQFIKPTPIQCLAIPAILRGHDAIIESHSGTGKTLAFLLPALQDSKKPLSTVIIVPTRELAIQIVYHANRIEALHNINHKYRTRAIVTSSDDDDLTSKQFKSIKSNIIVGTGKKLIDIVNDPSNAGLFRNTKRIIIDEIDRVLLPLKKHGSHRKRINRIKHRRAADAVCELLQTKSSYRKVQLICASATVVPELIDDLHRLGWDIDAKYLSYGLASTDSTTVKHQILEFDAHDHEIDHAKILTVTRFLNAKKENKPALLIVHRHGSVTLCVNQLRQYNISAVALHEQTMHNNQQQYTQLMTDLNSGEIDILVTNEESVRGLDFTICQNVIMLDVARTTVEYLHIAGRVGRMGAYGTATTLVNKRSSNDFKRLLLHYSRLALGYSKISF